MLLETEPPRMRASVKMRSTGSHFRSFGWPVKGHDYFSETYPRCDGKSRSRGLSEKVVQWV